MELKYVNFMYLYDIYLTDFLRLGATFIPDADNQVYPQVSKGGTLGYQKVAFQSIFVSIYRAFLHP